MSHILEKTLVMIFDLIFLWVKSQRTYSSHTTHDLPWTISYQIILFHAHQNVFICKGRVALTGHLDRRWFLYIPQILYLLGV